MTEHGEKLICRPQLCIAGIINPCGRGGDCYVARTKQKERVIYFGGRQKCWFSVFSKKFKGYLLRFKIAILNTVQKNMVWIYVLWEAVWKLLLSHCIQTEKSSTLLLLFQCPLNARNMVSIACDRSNPSECTIYMKQRKWIFVKGQECDPCLHWFYISYMYLTHTFVIILTWHS